MGHPHTRASGIVIILFCNLSTDLPERILRIYRLFRYGAGTFHRMAELQKTDCGFQFLDVHAKFLIAGNRIYLYPASTCVFFIPNVISVAVIAYLWKFIYNPDFGLLNNIIKAFGGKGGINWFSSDKAIWAVLVVLIWHGFGWGMLIYYTGIKNIDPVLYEAAAIDGANQRTTFLKITLPLMKPVIQVNVTMAVISALKQMETVYLLTNGGPGNKTQFAANYLYQQAFKAFKYGYGNAIGVVFIIICLLTTVILNKIFEDRDTVKAKKRKGAA